jgi:metal-responsive CopG/Arc/MetJ family transcriptional regulator
MPTTIHIHRELLEQVDRRAKGLGLSRSRYISQVLEQALRENSAWSDRFLREMREAREDKDSHQAVDEMMEAIRRRRTSKRPPRI